VFSREVGQPISEGIAHGITAAARHPQQAVQDAIARAIGRGKEVAPGMRDVGVALAHHLQAGFASNPDAILAPFQDAKYATDKWAGNEGVDNMKGVGSSMAAALMGGFSSEARDSRVAGALGDPNAPFNGVIRPGQAGQPGGPAGGVAGDGGAIDATLHIYIDGVHAETRRELIRTGTRNGVTNALQRS
jgi:hypothetical protein